MNWKRWTSEGRLHVQLPARDELANLLAVARRELADSKIEAISEDARFGHAYQAALVLVTAVVRSSGYRVASIPGHHRVTLEAARLALGDRVHDAMDHFELCRRRRNDILYDYVGVVSRRDVEELIRIVNEHERFVTRWLAARSSGGRA